MAQMESNEQKQCCQSKCQQCDPARFIAAKINRKIVQESSDGLPEELGCDDIQTVREFIEDQFESDMNWNNHGSVWHIGHKTPIKSPRNGIPPSKQTQKARLHYKNLQPFYKRENVKRGKTDLSKIIN
eukprot:40822_1